MPSQKWMPRAGNVVYKGIAYATKTPKEFIYIDASEVHLKQH